MMQNAPKISPGDYLKCHFVTFSAPPSKLKSEIRIRLLLSYATQQCRVSDFGRINRERPHTGRPKAGKRADFEALPIRIRPKSGPEARCPTRKHYCVTQGNLCQMFINFQPTLNHYSADPPAGFRSKQCHFKTYLALKR